MATTFIQLPTFAANGAGTATSVAGQSASKTFVNGGNGGVFEPFVTIEMSNEVVPLNWAPVWTFQGPDQVTLPCAARWMRAVVSNYRGGGAPNVDVGANTETVVFATLVASAGNGSGASVATSGLGGFKSVQVGGSFKGNVNIEISENGAADWSTVLSFQAGVVQSGDFTANFMRVTRTGVPGVDPGLPIIEVASTQGGGGGGGGSSSIIVEDEGVVVPNGPFGTLNFAGPGVIASDGGGGTALITVSGGISGVAFQEEGVAVVTATTANFVGAGATVTDVAGVATVTIPGGLTRIEDEGVSIGGPFQAINFAGAGVVATDAGGGEALVTIGGGITGIAFQEEGVAVVTSATANFVGAGATVTNAAGVATVTIPGGISGVAFQEEGVAVVTAATMNAVGNGIAITNVAGVATATVGARVFALPEQWAQLNVAASQTNVAISCQVSTSFDNYKALRAGSFVGLSTRFSETITAGQITVEITLNGAGTGVTVVSTSASNQDGGITSPAFGTVTFAAGDLIGVRVTTNAGFLPITSDVEAVIEVTEAV